MALSCFPLLSLLIVVWGVCGSVGSVKVAVLGGGVSGLSAAHELVERGFSVQVYDRQEVFGGKARSYDVPQTGLDGRANLPGEHGFRIFWDYYQNMYDTMQRIPYNSSLTVYDYMRRIGANELISENGTNVYVDFGPVTFQGLLDELRNLSMDGHFLSKEELAFSLNRVEILLTTCEDRMYDEFDEFSFAEFIGEQYRSENFTKYWLNLLGLGGIPANGADLGATSNFFQSLNSPWDDNIAVNVLQRPTNDAWIDPWVEYLTSLGASFYANTQIQSFTCSGDSITSVNVVDATGKVYPVNADYFIFAVPMDRMLSILQNSNTTGCAKLSSLDGLYELSLTWMVGMQYYLHKDLPITDGFALYLDSPWRLSSVSFRQWWPDFDWLKMGDGNESGIISAIISNFTAPGILYGKPAMECSPEEIQHEVWEQMKRHLNKHSVVLSDDNLAGFALDNSLFYKNGTLVNEEPMFYATPNSWNLSPGATTEFGNMFVCGDYVKAMTRVTPSSMEAANESARRAVNALLQVSGSKAKQVDIIPPARNPDFAAARIEDEVRFKLGLPHAKCESRGCVATS